MSAPSSPKARLPHDPEAARLSGAITALVATLAAFGVVMIYSASSIGIGLLRQDDATVFLRKQGLWLALATIVFALARTTDLAWLEKRARPLLGVTILLLIAVLIPGIGKKVGGARRWIRISGLNGEPSELAKLAVVIFAAHWGAAKHAVLDRFKEGFLPGFGAVVFTVGLIAIEPDMGTATFCAVIGTSVLFVAGIRLRHLFAIGAPGALAVGVVALAKLAYIMKRIEAWRDLENDADGTGYQIRQAVIALGSGGPFGLGLGESRQKRLFLPDGHTDFIFALIGEELGLVGTLALVVLFVGLIVLCMRAVERSQDRFSFLLGTGLALALGLQATMNMAVATASVPPKGIALPFVSFGGSSLLFCAAAAGLLARIAAHPNPARAAGSEPSVAPAVAAA